ncbi:tetratricopeptide repeat protein [Pseudalkalibacillus caeni]|uniref:Tetratricopeptide repeat protein n=1 Tax=Exobacillus caeni TaxID=2574798 RepID=A0A5R9EYI2_9BACL|nr:tetratricopeptide repeat protein [Pseudalkalibacillus caeni]TLS35901.1 tetratricopeptide repeat protein [Pseudalkalibacillus caeni]
MERLNKAITLVESGEVTEGLDELSELQKDADHETLYEIANLYYGWGLIDKSKELVEELLMFYPNEGQLLVLAAECYVESEQEQEAISTLSNITADDPAYPSALMLLADLYQSEGLEEVAEQKLLEAKKTAPNEPIITFGLGEFYLSQGQYVKAVPYYKQVLESSTEIADQSIALRLAEALSGSGHFEEAITYYEEGLIKNKEINALFGFGFTALQIHQYKKAIKAFEELKEIDHQYSTLYPYLANAYEEEGAIDEAVATLAKGIEVDEYNEALYLNASRLSFKQKDSESGERYLRSLLAINPSHTEGAKLLAGYLKDAERYEEVLELIDHLTEIGESDPYFEWYYATASNQIENYKEAIKHYENAYTYLKTNPVFLEEYGLFLMEEGKREEAVALFKQALSIDPSLVHLEEEVLRFEDEQRI